MNTIEAYENDISLEVKMLKNFNIPKLPKIKPNETIFCGSGDSLASSMLGESHSSFAVKAVDPLDLLKNKSIVKKKDLFIVSISGKTISNIKLAKLARTSYAITSELDSKLAKSCNEIIALEFPNSDVFTAGSISFLNSALICIALVKKFKIQNVQKIFSQAKRQSKNVQLSGNVYFLGNLHTYPIALYGAAKIYEILGISAFYERIEQFSHMELFSTKPGDTIIIFEEKNPHNTQLAKNLKNVGLNVIQPNINSKELISQFLFFTFFSQLIPLNLAKKNGQKDCNFVTSKKLRKTSDKMIY